jgi:glycosyltransferase involved in cell wall biosynthesis/peptidoglycan/xylan/chitin deacetylase (PgdA/CDA1 family)
MRPRAPALAVLTYHRVGDPGDGPPGLMSATVRAFERQMAWLAGTRRAVSLDNVLAARDGGPPLPPHAVLVTFDDAYADFATHAWPVLSRHGIPAVLFVPTAYPGDPGSAFWWDRLFAAVRSARGVLDTPLGPLPLRTPGERRRGYRVLRERVKSLPHDQAMSFVDELAGPDGGAPPRARVLGWDELRRLARAGVALGAHSRTHPLLSRVGPEEAAAEIVGSVEDLAAETGQAPAAFAFPGGGVPSGAEEALRDAGIRIAFTTARGVNPLDRSDWLALGRINVGRRTGRLALAAQVAAARPAAPPARPVPVERARIAYVMSRFPKLSETFVLAEILALERRGVAVDVYPLLRERADVVHPEAVGVVVRARYTPFVSPAILASQVAWLRRRPDAYLRALRDVLTGTWGSANFFVGALGIFPKVAHVALRMQADGVTHVHCHFANHPAVAGLIVHRLTGIPFSFTAHGSDLHKDRRMLARKVAEAAFVATISHDNRHLILAESGEAHAGKVHVVRTGVDTDLFAPADDDVADDPGDPLRIVCVGTLHEVKGQAHLVEACRLLAARGVPVRCRIIGDGEDRAGLEARIATAGLEATVRLTGPRTRGQIAEELRAADVLVAPSVPTREGRREGIPVVLMEAMSSGLAVVASAISGIPELVEHGTSGLLVPPGDAPAIAGALRLLASDPALRERLGRDARRRVLDEFDLEASADELIRRFGAEALP